MWRGSEGLQLVLRPDLSSPEKQSKKEVLTPVLGSAFASVLGILSCACQWNCHFCNGFKDYDVYTDMDEARRALGCLLHVCCFRSSLS